MKPEVFCVPNTSATTSAIKALAGMLARLPWGKKICVRLNGWKTRRRVC